MRMNLSMDPATRGRLQTCALLRKTTMSAIVKDALAEFVARNGLLDSGEWRIRPDATHAWCRASGKQADTARVLGWQVELVEVQA
jgi:predicted transcriptional regulator